MDRKQEPTARICGIAMTMIRNMKTNRKLTLNYIRPSVSLYKRVLHNPINKSKINLFPTIQFPQKAQSMILYSVYNVVCLIILEDIKIVS